MLKLIVFLKDGGILKVVFFCNSYQKLIKFIEQA